MSSNYHIKYISLDSPIGNIFIASTSKGILEVSIGETDEKNFSAYLREKHNTKVLRDTTAANEIIEDIKKYFKGSPVKFRCGFDLKGTTFQKRVWGALQRIPYGETRTYKDIARAIGNPEASRAVGNACGKNPIPVLIPCHRVTASDGSIGGYSGGIGIKKRLLKLEGIEV